MNTSIRPRRIRGISGSIFCFPWRRISSRRLSWHSQRATPGPSRARSPMPPAQSFRAQVSSVVNAVSGLSRTTVTDAAGHFQLSNIPLNPYHLTVSLTGFASYSQDVLVRSLVPVVSNAVLQVGTSSTVVNVDAGDLLEGDSTMHTDIDPRPVQQAAA